MGSSNTWFGVQIFDTIVNTSSFVQITFYVIIWIHAVYLNRQTGMIFEPLKQKPTTTSIVAALYHNILKL